MDLIPLEATNYKRYRLMKKFTSTLFIAFFFTACFAALPACSSTYETVADQVDIIEDDVQEIVTGDADVAVDSGFVSVNGVRLFYMEAGEGTPMILVHGWPLESGLFSRNIEVLAQNHHVIAIDLRGFGQSSWEGDAAEVRVEMYADDVLAVMDEMGIEQAVIGGMSMGGPIAFAMYQEAPERFIGLLLIDTIAAAAAPPEKHLWIGWTNYIENMGVDAIPGYVMDEMLTAEARMDQPQLVDYVSSLMMNASEEGAIAGANALAYRPNFRPMLEEITAPTLILVGMQDTIYPYGTSQYMHQHIPNSELVIIDGGSHAAIIEEAGAANDAILDWMDDMPQYTGDL